MREKPHGDRAVAKFGLGGFVPRRHAARRKRWRNLFGGIRSLRRGIASFLLLIYLIVLGNLTLCRFHQVNPAHNLIPGRTILHDLGNGGAELVINTLGNITATLPLGALLPIVLPRRACLGGPDRPGGVLDQSADRGLTVLPRQAGGRRR